MPLQNRTDHTASRRFTVFGIRDDCFVEFNTENIVEAVFSHDNMSCNDFFARIWDAQPQRFLSNRTIDYAKVFLADLPGEKQLGFVDTVPQAQLVGPLRAGGGK